MKTILFLLIPLIWSWVANAQQQEEETPRDPAATASTPLSLTAKRNYPGAADEEDLQVQNRLPDATLKTDSHSVQRGVYKTLYNEELKDEGRESTEE